MFGRAEEEEAPAFMPRLSGENTAVQLHDTLLLT